MANLQDFALSRRLFGEAAHGPSAMVLTNELARVRRNEEHWNFYFGKQWNFQRDDGEPLVTLNIVKPVIDKGVAFLAGAGFKIQVPEVLQNYTLPRLNDTWEANGKLSIAVQSGLTGALTGDVWVLVTYQSPNPVQLRLNPHARGSAKIILLSSSQVFPVWNPLNLDELMQVTIVTEYSTVDPSLATSQKSVAKVKKFKQTITADTITEEKEGDEPKTYPNILGEIPIIHIRNLPIPNEFFGMSDLDGGPLDTQRELNEKSTDISDIINYNGSPITVVKGAKAQQLERSPKQIWSGLPADASVEYLTLQGGIDSYLNYVKIIRQSFFEQVQTPEHSLGGTERPISNTAGVALQLEMAPLVEKTNKKKSQYEPGFQKINYFILRVLQEMEGLKLPTDLCENCGGKIHEYLDEYNNLRRKCYEVDTQNFDFLHPDQALITVIREHSFGREVKEIPYKQFKDEFALKYTSFWDPAEAIVRTYMSPEEVQLAEKVEADEAASFTGFGAPPPPPQNKGPLQLKTGMFKLPDEPESFTQVVIMGYKEDGSPFLEERAVTAVPTGCKKPQHLDPFKNTVLFESSLPKDKHLELGYVTNAVNAHIRSRIWAMEQIGVDNIEDETSQIIKEQGLFGFERAVTDVIEEELPERSEDALSEDSAKARGEATVRRSQNRAKASDIARKSPKAGKNESE